MATADSPAAGAAGDNSLLVERIAQGDRDAEDEFVRRYIGGVHGLVRRHTRPGDPAVDDLVQDVLSNVLQKLRAGALRDGTALPAYVRSTVVFAARAEYRQRRNVDPIDPQKPDPGDSPAELAENADTRRAVTMLVGSLPTVRDREVLLRFYLGDESKESICARLHIEESHFRRVIFRARDRLRQLLNEAGLGSAR
jgi:RNA polymerase sigma-70 factor (ECF subfamily)